MPIATQNNRAYFAKRPKNIGFYTRVFTVWGAKTEKIRNSVELLHRNRTENEIRTAFSIFSVLSDNGFPCVNTVSHCNRKSQFDERWQQVNLRKE